MAATLASYGSALALEHAERLGMGVVVLAVVLSLTLSRTYHAGDLREWLLGLVVLSLLAVAASEVGVLLVRHSNVGDALFVVAISGSIWVRRFGGGFARAERWSRCRSLRCWLRRRSPARAVSMCSGPPWSVRSPTPGWASRVRSGSGRVSSPAQHTGIALRLGRGPQVVGAG